MPDDDFKPSPPYFQMYIADDNGDVDFKNRNLSGGLWKKEKGNKVYFTGKVAGKRVIMFINEPPETAKEEW